MSLQAAIFDLNGVFITSPLLSDRFKQDYGIKEDVFLPALKSVMKIVRQPDAPSIHEAFSPYFQQWGLSITEEDSHRYWFEAETPNKKMIALARQLKEQGIEVYALSNNFRERANYYKQNFDFLSLFGKIYYSWQTGHVKPHQECWRQILIEQDLLAENCIYFDDSQKNVVASGKLGIRGYVYESPEATKRQIAPLLPHVL